MSTENEPAEAQPKRKVIKRELAKQRKVQVEQGGLILDQWSEPRLRLTDGEDTLAPFDGKMGEHKTFNDRLLEDDRHRVTGAPLAHNGSTCGNCAHFKLKGRDGRLYEHTAEVNGMPRIGTNVCCWASWAPPRQTSPGEPACVKHEDR